MRELRLAMKIDKVYPINEVIPRHWERCASSAKAGIEFTIQAARHQIAIIPDMALACAAKVRAEGITHEIVDRLVDTISTRAKDLKKIYGAESGGGSAPTFAVGR
jgi:serine/threonine-protein kinase HipA